MNLFWNASSVHGILTEPKLRTPYAWSHTVLPGNSGQRLTVSMMIHASDLHTAVIVERVSWYAWTQRLRITAVRAGASNPRPLLLQY